MAGIVLEDVSRVFPGRVAAVNRLNLEVADGELLVIVGPSGSGKTTILRLIAGLDRPTSGTVRIGGRSVNGVAPRARDLAMVFQGHSLYPHLSVQDNLAFSLRLRRKGRWWQAWLRPGGEGSASAVPAGHDARQTIDEAVRQAASSLGIEGLLARMPNELSGGERQRVALGRAIVRRPAAFLFDEPLSGLDAQLRAQLRRELKQLHQRLRTTTVHVTHDQVEALGLGDRVAVIDRGELQQIGEPLELYDRPVNRFVAGFLGSPAMNFLECSLAPAKQRESDLSLLAGGWLLELPAAWLPPDEPPARNGDKQNLTLGIRPEDLRVTRAPRPAGAGEGGDPQADLPTDLPDRTHGAGDWWRLGTGRIDAWEPLGDATILHLRPFLGPQRPERPSPGGDNSLLLSKVPGRTELKPGDRVTAWCDRRRAHWFDRESGRRLGSPGFGTAGFGTAGFGTAGFGTAGFGTAG
jgi:multiple sugar transport system ATP-binding protein